jgi:hypothetical protein
MKVKDLILELSYCDPEYDIWVIDENDPAVDMKEPSEIVSYSEDRYVVMTIVGQSWLDDIIENECSDEKLN